MPPSRAASLARIRRRVLKRYPVSIRDASLDAALAELRDALDLDELWRATVALLDLSLPNFQYIAALPCVEDRPIWVSTTVPGSDRPGYWDRFISCEPPLSRVLASDPLAKVSFMNDHWPDAELMATRFHERVMEPEGWWYAAGLIFRGEDGYLGHIGMNRTVAQGPYLPSERALLLDLHPHLEAAVKRVAAFDKERSKRAALEEILKEQPDGMLILDWEMKPVFSNRAADEACRLWQEDLRESGEIPAEVKAAASQLMGGVESLFRQPPPGKLAPPTAQLFHPTITNLRARIRVLRPRAKQAIKPHFLIEFSRVFPFHENEPAVAAFSLTMGERRVAELVAAGKSNPEVAAELSLSVNTVRAHLREVFSKLGLTNRGQLAGALARNRHG